MKLSVIIPCYNAADTIEAQLVSLSQQEYSDWWEVIVSDNGSNDDTLAIVQRFHGLLPHLRILDASDRPGAAHARNVGARAAAGEILAFCDADDEVAPGWVQAIGEALTQYDFVASRFELDKLNTSWVARGQFDRQQNGLQKTTYPPYLQRAGGCGLGIKRSLHETLGGFDETLLQQEDTDYCYRAQLAGVQLHFVPVAIIHVRERTAFGRMFHQVRRWAISDVLLSKRYCQTSEMQVNSVDAWMRYAKRWAGLLWWFIHIRRKEEFANWVRHCAWNIGILQGSIKYRTHPLI